MIVHAYYPLGETRVQREAEALLRHSIAVDVICLRSRDEPTHDVFKGVQVYRLPVRRHVGGGRTVQLLEYLAFLFLAMYKVTALHLRRRYRTIQVHNPPDFLALSAILPKLFGARVILDLHDLMPEFYQGRFQRDERSFSVRLVRLQERISCRFADHVITVSQHWRDALAARGIPAEKISVVMNVADDNIFRTQPDSANPRRYGEELRLIYHGTVTGRYGLDLALKAIARLQSAAPNLHLTILGEGDQMQSLMRMSDELGIDAQVTFDSQLRPAEELPSIILSCDAGIVPYRNDPFTDGLVPTKLLEYVALGMPSIAARTTAISAYFDEGMVEFFTPDDIDDLARCLLRVYNDRERLEELAQNTGEFNQRYNWGTISADYVVIVERLGS